MSIVFDVPANILLCGEYLVTLPGGIGVWLALDTRARCTVAKKGRGFVAIDSSDRPQTLPSLCHEVFLNKLAQHSPGAQLPGIELLINTESFYDPSGQKKGFGSSAAVTVLTIGALSELASEEGIIISPDEILQWCIEAHRRFQNGRGSGYDICASFYGGMGQFVGGQSPKATPFTNEGILCWDFIRGGIPVSSASALAHFVAFTAEHEEATQNWFEKSNEISKKMGQALKKTSTEDFELTLEESKKLGIEIGDAIGVDARIPGNWKAVGAGNELGISLKPDGKHKLDDIGLRRIG